MSTTPYLTPQQLFQIQYESASRDEVAGVLLAFFFGCFGIHHFYLNRTGMGILYLCFCWTGIPAILGVIECFFMPGRVRIYNAVQAERLAAALGLGLPGYWGYPAASSAWTGYNYDAPPSTAVSAPVYPNAASGEIVLAACGNCGQTNPAGARFCSHCGNRLG